MSVIAGGRLESCEPNAFVAGSRAGDRLEPWALPDTAVVARLAERAAAAGLDPDLAVRLCVEVALARVTLRQVGVDPRTIDQLAEAPRFQRQLDDRDAAYARRLTHAAGDRQPGPTRPLSTVGLPLRLTAQLVDVDLTDLLSDADPGQARAWELAALADGRTISEWALLAALRDQTARFHA